MANKLPKDVPTALLKSLPQEQPRNLFRQEVVDCQSVYVDEAQDPPLLPARLAYGVLTPVVLMILVVGIMLVGLWPINPQHLVNGYLVDSDGSVDSGLFGTFHVTPAEAADLIPGKPMTLSIDGFSDKGFGHLKGSVIAHSGESTSLEQPPAETSIQSPTVVIMVRIVPPDHAAKSFHETLSPGLAIRGRYYRTGNSRRVLDFIKAP